MANTHELDSYKQQWLLLQDKIDTIISDLQQINDDAKSDIKIETRYLEFKIPTLSKLNIREENDELWIENDSKTDYHIYKRSIWEQILFHQEHYHSKRGSAHIKSCENQYKSRKPQKRKYLSSEFQMNREIEIALELVKNSKNYNEFQMNKKRYDGLILEMKQKSSVKSSEIVRDLNLYNGIEFSGAEYSAVRPF
jgi:hypothetical protein